MPDKKPETINVKVTVPPRPEFPGVWAGGRLWNNGETIAMVSEEMLKNLQSRANVVTQVLSGPPEPSSSAKAESPSAPKQEDLNRKGEDVEPASSAKPQHPHKR